MKRLKSEDVVLTVDDFMNMEGPVSPRVYKHLTIDGDFIVIHVNKGYDYDIQKDEAMGAEAVCMWLGQIAEKTWGSPELLGELVLAFNDLNGDLRSF